MIFSKKLRKTAASVLALVMVFAMSTGAFAYGGTATLDGDYYNVTVSYTVEGTLATDAQISIIALAGAEDANAKVEFDGTTATNVLWIDQQAASQTGGTFEFQVAKADAANGFNIKSGVTGGQTMTGYVTIAQQPALSNDASISAITVNNKAAAITETTATVTLDANASTAAIAVTAATGATYTITPESTALSVGENTFTIEVTAQDGTTKKTYTLKVNNPEAGTVTPPAGGEVIEKEDITIGGNEVTDSSAVIESTKPFDIEDGHVVKVKQTPVMDGDTVIAPDKVVAHNGSTSGVETFYTEYKVNGETVIKLITIITDEALTSGDLTLVDGTPEKLVYGDMSGDKKTTGADLTALLNKVAAQWKGTNTKDRLIADVTGDGKISGADLTSLLNVVASQGAKLPPAAQ